MARRRSSSTEQKPQPAYLSVDQMKSATQKIERMIGRLNEFDPKTVEDRSDPRIEVLEAAVDSLLVSVFGANTLDYKRYRAAKHIDTGPAIMGGTPIREVREGLEEGKARAVALFQSIIEQFNDELRVRLETLCLITVPCEPPCEESDVGDKNPCLCGGD